MSWINYALKMCIFLSTVKGSCVTSSKVEVYTKHLALVRCNPSLLTVNKSMYCQVLMLGSVCRLLSSGLMFLT